MQSIFPTKLEAPHVPHVPGVGVRAVSVGAILVGAAWGGAVSVGAVSIENVSVEFDPIETIVTEVVDFSGVGAIGVVIGVGSTGVGAGPENDEKEIQT